MNISRRSGLLAAIGALLGAAAGCAARPAAPSGGAGSGPGGSGSPGTGPPNTGPASTGEPATPPATAAGREVTAAVPDPLPAGAVNALVFGTDSRTPGADTGNADALVLAQLSPDRARVTLVSITRDSYVPIAGGGRGKINSAYARGGSETLAKTVSALFGGLPIHVTAQTDFTDFIRLTRLLDGFGVDNLVPSTVTSSVTGKVSRFPRGRLVLHGADWLIYARQRKGLPRGDLDRAERHRAVLTGMLDRLRRFAAAGPARFGQLAAAVGPRVRLTGTVRASELAGLLPVVRNLGAGDVTSLMVPVARYASIGGASVNVLDDTRTAALGAALRAGDVRPYVRKYGRG